MLATDALLKELGISKEQSGCSTGKNWFGSGAAITASSPVDGKTLGTVTSATVEDYEQVLQTAAEAFVLAINSVRKKLHWVSWFPTKLGNPTRKAWEKYKR